MPSSPSKHTVSIQFTASALVDVDDPEDYSDIEYHLEELLSGTDIFVNDIENWAELKPADFDDDGSNLTYQRRATSETVLG